jgi:hypothetical protein
MFRMHTAEPISASFVFLMIFSWFNELFFMSSKMHLLLRVVPIYCNFVHIPIVHSHYFLSLICICCVWFKILISSAKFRSSRQNVQAYGVFHWPQLPPVASANQWTAGTLKVKWCTLALLQILQNNKNKTIRCWPLIYNRAPESIVFSWIKLIIFLYLFHMILSSSIVWHARYMLSNGSQF